MTYQVRFLSRAVASLMLVAGFTASLNAQAIPPVVPVSNGFNLPHLGGQFTYALTASQLITFGYAGNSANGNVYQTNIGGDLAYLSNSEKHPFSMIYSGGYLASESDQIPSAPYQNLSLSQVYRTRKDAFIAADTVSYLPQSPVTGLSGIPGVGDLGISPVQVTGTVGPGILTNYATRVTNIVSLSDSHAFTPSTSLQGTGAYSISRFTGNVAPTSSVFDSNQVDASGGINHRINARSSVGVNYVYSHFSYTDNPFTFNTNGVNLEYIYHFSRKMTIDASVGPQWNAGTTFGNTALNVAAAVNVNYLGERSSGTLSYTRGTNSGSGVVAGALLDTVGFVGRHNFTRELTGAVTATYTHSGSLPTLQFQPFDVNSEIFGGQLSRGIGPSLSVYGSYTFERQTSSNYLVNTIAFNGTQQVLGFGITYSPRSHLLGH
jgi:hypothetical protein